MSWSVNAKGKPQKVKLQLESQFATARRNVATIESELQQVTRTQELINSALEFMEHQPAVDVSASGSVSSGSEGWAPASQLLIKIEPIHGILL